MRFARKLALLAVMAMAAMAFAAPSAFGQGLEITDETQGGHCPENVAVTGHTVTGGCLVHARSETEFVLRQHIFGIESTAFTCEEEFHARLNHLGEGYIFNQQLTQHPGDVCDREACEEEIDPPPFERRPWHAIGRENNNTTDPHPTWENILRKFFCIEDPTSTTHPSGETQCVVDVPFREDPANSHKYEFGETTEMPGIGTAGFRCELIGHWLTEAVPQGGEVDVEVNHV